ncbi:MAG: cupin domain-containing protein [Chloroflexi bacterium]|nr:cupin domain-containing protein [Chloroflexota bacterium]MCH9040017.1 cupin domain-containing protein [Chloroflexota bacterium]
MESFEILDVITMQKSLGERYLEFFKGDNLSLGLYSLRTGDEDTQQPHTEDEVYYVVSGHAKLKVGDNDRSVKPGSIVFVSAGVEHRFHEITETLMVMVVFAPPRDSQT